MLAANSIFWYAVCSVAQLWTVAHQALLSVEFSKQEYWNGLPFPLPRDLSNPGMEPTSLASPALAGRFFTTVPPGKPTFLDAGLLNPFLTRVWVLQLCLCQKDLWSFQGEVGWPLVRSLEQRWSHWPLSALAPWWAALILKTQGFHFSYSFHLAQAPVSLLTLASLCPALS